MPRQHLVVSAFWILAILVGVLWHLIVVLIFISLMTWDVEWIFQWHCKHMLWVYGWYKNSNYLLKELKIILLWIFRESKETLIMAKAHFVSLPCAKYMGEGSFYADLVWGKHSHPFSALGHYSS